MFYKKIKDVFSNFKNIKIKTKFDRSMYSYKLLNFEQAKVMIENLQVLLIDVRTKEEYDFMHINNAINIPVNNLEREILKYDINKEIMVYCSSGSRSKVAIQILNKLGYNNIYIWEYGALSTFPFKDMIIYKNN